MLIALLAGVGAMALSVLARLLGRRSAWRRNGLLSETVLTAVPILAMAAASVVLANGVDRRFSGILLGALLLANPLVWRPAPGGLRPHQIAVMLAAGLLAVWWGVRIESFRHPLSDAAVTVGQISVYLTIAWLMAMTAAFFTTRRLEGLSLALAVIAASALALIILLQRQDLTLARALAAGVAGSTAGLLLLALIGLRPPAGELTGAVLGFLLGSAAVVGMSKTSTLLSLGIPLLMLAIPAISITTLAWDRLRERIVVTEVRHDVYSLLLNRGLPKHKVIVFIAAVEAYLAALAVLLVMLRVLSPLSKMLFFVGAAVLGVPAFGRFLRVLSRSGSGIGSPEPLLLDVKVDLIGMEDAIQRIETFILSRKPHHIVTSDTPALARALEDTSFRDIVNAAHLVIPDGIGVVWAGRVLGMPVRERVPGIDLMEELCRLSAERGYRVYLFGGKPGVAEEAARRIAAKYPGANLVGTHQGYFAAEEEAPIVEAIRRARPDILFVALGSPLQDYWIRDHIGTLGTPVCIGVGGSFDVFAGRLGRAPKWMRQLGLEWVYRAMQEPWRVRRLVGIPKVITVSLKKKIQSYWS